MNGKSKKRLNLKKIKQPQPRYRGAYEAWIEGNPNVIDIQMRLTFKRAYEIISPHLNKGAKTMLLTRGNPKIMKGEKQGYLTHILHLAPSGVSGYNVCPHASKGCIMACLNLAGRGGLFKKGESTNVIQQARIRKTKWFMEDRFEFMNALVKDIEAGIRYAEKRDLKPVFRLNGTSDIEWEVMPVIRDSRAFSNVFEAFPDIQFYDYTKNPDRDVTNISNYHLTFSRSESNQELLGIALGNGMNVAVVFDKLPETYIGLPVFDGDESDLRFLDPAQHIIGLYAKGKAKKDTTGFVVK